MDLLNQQMAGKEMSETDLNKAIELGADINGITKQSNEKNTALQSWFRN